MLRQTSSKRRIRCKGDSTKMASARGFVQGWEGTVLELNIQSQQCELLQRVKVQKLRVQMRGDENDDGEGREETKAMTTPGELYSIFNDV